MNVKWDFQADKDIRECEYVELLISLHKMKLN